MNAEVSVPNQCKNKKHSASFEEPACQKSSKACLSFLKKKLMITWNDLNGTGDFIFGSCLHFSFPMTRVEGVIKEKYNY